MAHLFEESVEVRDTVDALEELLGLITWSIVHDIVSNNRGAPLVVEGSSVCAIEKLPAGFEIDGGLIFHMKEQFRINKKFIKLPRVSTETGIRDRVRTCQNTGFCSVDGGRPVLLLSDHTAGPLHHGQLLHGAGTFSITFAAEGGCQILFHLLSLRGQRAVD